MTCSIPPFYKDESGDTDAALLGVSTWRLTPSADKPMSM
ncbi:hypothetical protein ASZ90_018029 [hydrocarbon metagenome]|uniref:Uncharacterized protein n=1 Tax=hydrocarbon metagenome TaxID=938273 RepID=A0A0W8E7E0_9ZZZZ